MCTAVSYNCDSHYFGRNLDWDYSFGENVIISPRNFKFTFKSEKSLKTHHAIMGIGIIKDNYPLYFDAVNEFGLCIAGLNFPDNATYFPLNDKKTNVAPYEFIPFILGKCKTVAEAIDIIQNISFLDIPFNVSLHLTPMHWIVSDRTQSITVEPLKNGTKVYQNPVGILTNNPTFDMQMHNLNNYLSLSPEEPENTFSAKLDLFPYSRGMGAIGLPGDFSSQSRFVRATFIKSNIVTETSEEKLSSFFHILSSAKMPKGCVITKHGNLEHTIYSNCYDTENSIIYLKTYTSKHISEFCMHKHNLSQSVLITKSDL